MQQIRIAFILSILLTIITGLIYPLSITLIAEQVFPWQANGSLIKINNQIVGSKLIGQLFSSPKYFWGRPSATKLYAYNGLGSSGSNQGPSNQIFIDLVHARLNFLKKTNGDFNINIPSDLVFASASGLDPDISPEAAYFQTLRISNARGIAKDAIDKLISNSIESRTFGILGEPRVNVLLLNLGLDALGDNNV